MRPPAASGDQLAMARQEDPRLAVLVLGRGVEGLAFLGLEKHLAPGQLALELLESQALQVALDVEELEADRRVLELELVEDREVVRLQLVPGLPIELPHQVLLPDTPALATPEL